jgi:hypothetical protein
MPVFRTYNRTNYSTSIRPVGVRRCWPLGLFPYWYGSDVKFEVGVKSRTTKALPYQWRLSMLSGQGAHWVSQNNNGVLRPNEKYKVIYVGNLFRPGQYSLQMRWGDDIANEKNWELMAAFTIIDRDIQALNWALALIGIIVGAIVGALVTLVIT